MWSHMMTKEYLPRVRKILESRLNGGNIHMGCLIAEIRSWHWTQGELEALDRRMHKLMKMNNALHPKIDTDKLYLPRQDGDWGLISATDPIVIVQLEVMRGKVQRV